MPRYAANPALTIDIMPLGRSREPLLQVDDFLAAPEGIVAAAARASWRDLPPGGYPGRRAGLPRDYVKAVLQRMDGPIRARLLGGAKVKLDRFDCAFSMVTQAPAALTPLQRVPHIDIANGARVAILHYLCDARFGGTAFFRQEATGLEQVGPEDKARYLEARARDLAALGPEHGYPGEDIPGYARTASVAARFNRLVAYRSFSLHSGIIDAPDRLSPDPAQGRLTVTIFADYVPEADDDDDDDAAPAA